MDDAAMIILVQTAAGTAHGAGGLSRPQLAKLVEQPEDAPMAAPRPTCQN